MDRNCMNCVRREVVVDLATGEVYSRCSLDRTMRVNRRMSCEAWSNTVTLYAGAPYMTAWQVLNTRKGDSI